jgi:hypothetical protein
VSAPSEAAKETSQVHRQVSSLPRLATMVLLVGIVAGGCAKQAGTVPVQAAGSTPAAQSSPVVAVAPTLVSTDAPSDSAAPSQTAGASAPAAPNATPDPLDSPFSELNNLLNGIDSSLSGADAGTTGGE